MKQKLSIIILTLATVIFGAVSIDAKSKADDAYIKKVRQIYSNSVNASKDEYTAHMACTANHILPATGMQNVKFDFYYQIDGPDDVHDSTIISNVFLIRLSYNFAARNFYEEYLFDDKGNLIFFYQSGDGILDDYEKTEFRYYFKPNGALVYANQKDSNGGKVVRNTDLKGGGQLVDEAHANANKYVAALKNLFLL